jgi:hypothetical protein
VQRENTEGVTIERKELEACECAPGRCQDLRKHRFMEWNVADIHEVTVIETCISGLPVTIVVLRRAIVETENANLAVGGDRQAGGPLL